MILLALLLAATPINAQTLKARTESTQVQIQFRKELAELRKQVLARCWDAAGDGMYFYFYCLPHDRDHKVYMTPLRKSLQEVGIYANVGPDESCLVIDWGTP